MGAHRPAGVTAVMGWAGVGPRRCDITQRGLHADLTPSTPADHPARRTGSGDLAKVTAKRKKRASPITAHVRVRARRCPRAGARLTGGDRRSPFFPFCRYFPQVGRLGRRVTCPLPSPRVPPSRPKPTGAGSAGAHFAGFADALTAGQRRVVELHYVGGWHGRSRVPDRRAHRGSGTCPRHPPAARRHVAPVPAAGHRGCSLASSQRTACRRGLSVLSSVLSSVLPSSVAVVSSA